MGDQIIRLQNVVALCKLETTEGVDASPASSDSFPFEIDSVQMGSPYTTEDSNEATGTEIAGPPLIIGQPVTLTMRMRLKGAGPGVTYTSTVKPPMDALLRSAGLRGVFQAGVAATALAAGTTTSATLATPFASTAQLYRGMPLNLTGAAAGFRPLVADYSSGRVATLADLMGSALSTTSNAAIAANWTYAATSPADATERAADQPSSTIYFHEDGIRYKLFGFRGTMKLDAESGKPGFAEISGEAIWGGQADVAQPTDAIILNHSAPLFDMGSNLSSAFIVNRKPLPINNFTFDWGREVTSHRDPNTSQGFGAATLMGRKSMLDCDPLKTTLAGRNHLNDLETTGSAGFTGAIRLGAVAGNRVSITLPRLIPVKVDMASRDGARSESLSYRALSAGRDASGRDGDCILCFD